LTGHDLCSVAFAASVLCRVLARGQSTFDINLTTFVEQPPAVISEFSEGNDPMPLDTICWRAVSVSESFFGRY
jgi:hypothetical protein